MVKLFWLEFKSLICSKKIIAFLVSAVFISILLAVIPISMASADIMDCEGNSCELNGLSAIQYWKASFASSNGAVTTQKLKYALTTYQESVKNYGSPEKDTFPADVKYKMITPNTPLYMLILDAYNKGRVNNLQNGAAVSLEKIDVHNLDDFYQMCASGVEQELISSGVSDKTRNLAISMYKEVEKPFMYFSGYTSELPTYLSMDIFILVLFSVVVCSSSFAEGYESGSDQILRCARFGRNKLAWARILASILVCAAIYLVGITIHTIIIDICYGTDSLKSSVQSMGDTSVLINMSIGELQISLILMGFLTLIATSSMTLFISSNARNSSGALVVSMFFAMLPTFLYATTGNSWVYAALPSRGVGFPDTDMLAGLMKCRFLELGNNSFWNPHITLCAAILWTPLLMAFTVRSYCRHKN